VISIVVISKDEPALDETLAAVDAQARALDEDCELIVVDASEGRLDEIRQRHPGVSWIDFERPPGVRVSIPHQRNAGVRAANGETIVFVDAGCEPREAWLERLVAPIRSGHEDVVAGIAPAPNDVNGIYDAGIHESSRQEYLPECPTINVAFRRSAFDAVGGFDEAFEYGSDIDFSWRLVDAGHRIRSAPDAAVEHDWGDSSRQLKRAYAYGKARVRLYNKHRSRLRTAWREDPMVFVYPTFILGLPLTLRFPLYPALLAIPALRNRRQGSLRVVADHLAFGAGGLVQLTRR
jgi:GT2 family glycosyltransferase